MRSRGTTLSELEQVGRQMADQVALAGEMADRLGVSTDLVSTGTARGIRERALRDEISLFFQAAEQNQVVIEKNSTQLIDGLLVDSLA